MMYLAVVLMFLGGGFMIFNPEAIWKFEHYFSVKDGEPTDTYIDLVRLGGVGFLVLSVILLVVLIVPN